MFIWHNIKAFCLTTLSFFLCTPVYCLLCDLLKSGSAELRTPLNGRKPPPVAVRR